MLVIDYSCGIKLSTATAFSAAINTAVKQGVLIKGGTFIEQMSSANTVLLDKTGTITEGRPRIVSAVVLKEGMSEKEVLSYAMAAEETSTHPLAGAIMRYGRELGASPKAHGDVVTEVSRGSRTLAGKKTIRVGNIEYMRENGVKAAAPLPGETGAIPNYVGVGSEIVAVLFAMDSPRENVRRAINSLRYDGVGDIELLTGDMESQARTVAEQVGADGCDQLLAFTGGTGTALTGFACSTPCSGSVEAAAVAAAAGRLRHRLECSGLGSQRLAELCKLGCFQRLKFSADALVVSSG